MTIEDLTELEARQALDTLVKQIDQRLSVCQSSNGNVAFQYSIMDIGPIYMMVGYKDHGSDDYNCLMDFKTCKKALEEFMKYDEIYVPGLAGAGFKTVKIPSSIEELLIQTDIA